MSIHDQPITIGTRRESPVAPATRGARRFGAALTIMLLVLSGCAPRGCPDEAGGSGFPTLQGPYLGQTPPGSEPELFAPGLVSTGFYERDLLISPDGDEIYYGLVAGRTVTIMVTRLEDEVQRLRAVIAELSAENLELEKGRWP